MTSDLQNDLIFDFGLHKGFDAEFYLRKGFRVVGIEADPDLAEQWRQRLSAYENRLTVINKALFHEPGQTVKFFTVPGKDDWGSLDKDIAQKGIHSAVEIEVETVDLATLFDDHGIPHYIKCDLEGGDAIFLAQLLRDSRRPRFVSVEMSDGTEGRMLAECGYELGQIVNQWMHYFKAPPDPPGEGEFAAVQFTGEMSGLFGRELDRTKWRTLGDIEGIYRRWKDLHDIDGDLAPGWLDPHACRVTDLHAVRE